MYSSRLALPGMGLKWLLVQFHSYFNALFNGPHYFLFFRMFLSLERLVFGIFFFCLFIFSNLEVNIFLVLDLPPPISLACILEWLCIHC